MYGLIIKFIFIVCPFYLIAQTTRYNISFENAAHHEALVSAQFSAIDTDTLFVQMSRSSPGRYALHEFAKNVYNLSATDGEGKVLKTFRPDPYKWGVIGHNGMVNISYTLFANWGDGTYSQIDESHAHLNMPATFLFAPQLSERRIEVTFKAREDLNWKVASQLPLVGGTTFYAPNLYYFMDSPTELSNFGLKSFEVASNGSQYTIQLALHHGGTEEELNTYFESVKKVVMAEQAVFGELPDFDYGTYTFIACYVPNVSGDGMEHRNSTILTSTRSLADGGISANIGTVSHEFFHAWNVERIRPKSLEPFNFSAANMSGELWFAEGFTSYYTNLILCRAGLKTAEEYVEGLTSTFNSVWTSPAVKFFNPVEMSYQAPFTDAATSVDPVNRVNTFISYYSYGSVLGLALDLSLRENGLDLDSYMRMIWDDYGRKEVPYTIKNLHQCLNKYAGEKFGDSFFNSYIYNSMMPDYHRLFRSVGIVLKKQSEIPYFGNSIIVTAEGTAIINEYTVMGSPAYEAGLEKGDVILSINGIPFNKDNAFSEGLMGYKIGDSLAVKFIRSGKERHTRVVLGAGPDYSIELQEKEGAALSRIDAKRRDNWLKNK